MSRTQFKNAQRVWNALVALAMPDNDGYRWHWHTAGEVAEKAGMSAPTARKYLEVAADEGAANALYKKRVTLYRVSPDRMQQQ